MFENERYFKICNTVKHIEYKFLFLDLSITFTYTKKNEILFLEK